jgi:hypothetical protein
MQMLIVGCKNMDWIEQSLDWGIQRQASMVVVVNIKWWFCGLLHLVLSCLYPNIWGGH